MSTDEPQLPLQLNAGQAIASTQSSSQEGHAATQDQPDSGSAVVASTSDGSVVIEADPALQDGTNRTSPEEVGEAAAAATAGAGAIPSDSKAVLEPVEDLESANARSDQLQDETATAASSGQPASGPSDLEESAPLPPSMPDEPVTDLQEPAQDLSNHAASTDKADASSAAPPPPSVITSAILESSAMLPSASATSSTAATAGTGGRATPPITGSIAGGLGTSPSKLAPPKKFTSSLSMNKKFLEKWVHAPGDSGNQSISDAQSLHRAGAAAAAASDSKSPQLTTLSLPKPGLQAGQSTYKV